ncbi:hypothetical protein ACVIGB_001064 [Bradyrhizobium sp. USDA 4341]
MSQNYQGSEVAPGDLAVMILGPGPRRSARSGAKFDWSLLAIWTFISLNVIGFWALVTSSALGRWSWSIGILVTAAALWAVFFMGSFYARVRQKHGASPR